MASERSSLWAMSQWSSQASINGRLSIQRRFTSHDSNAGYE
jgi:hypothetical protein